MAEDPLDILRDCVEKKRQIKEVSGKICLGGRYFLKTAESTFPIHQPKGNKQRAFYQLGDILFFKENHTLSHSEYEKRAQENKKTCVRRCDRKNLLSCIFGDSGVKTRSSTRQQPSKTTDSTSFVSKDSVPSPSQQSPEIGKRKTNIRTYSRKRSPHEFRRQDSANEDQIIDMDAIHSSNSEELDLIKNENIAMDQALKSMTSFLKDHLGVTDDQLSVIQNSESNTVDLSNIASEVKSNIVRACVCPSTNSPSQPSIDNSRQCYKAVKHPLRGWEMIKQDLSSVLLGDTCFEQWKEHESASIDECLSKGSMLLKRAFSVLISQLKEFNKLLKSQDESDTFCQKVVKDCLTDAVDGFRDLFNKLLASENIEDQTENLEKWVDMSRTELQKLFNSLVMTLQSLRDISTSNQKPPISLFHLPEPTFSLALNPAKVTHSVVLEMYIRIGLAELKQILAVILGHTSETRNITHALSSANGSPINVVCENEETETSEKIETDESVEFVSPFFGSQSIEQIDAPSQCTSSSVIDQSLPQSCPESDVDSHHTNGEIKSYSNIKAVPRKRRQSGSGFCQYSAFKTTVGSTLVSSFKKQIQEKINARDFISQ